MARCRRNVELPALAFLLNIISKDNLISIINCRLTHSQAGCDIDVQTYDGNSPLHVAAGRGLKGQTALLVAAGANVTLENSEEEIPFDLASVAEVILR